MTDNSWLCCAWFKSRTSTANKRFWQRILGHILFIQPIYTSLYLPPPIFHAFSIRSSLSPGITNTSAGGRITDKSPGVLDSAPLAGAKHALACPTSCHIGLRNQLHIAAQFKNNTESPQDPQLLFTHTHTLTDDDKATGMCYILDCVCYISNAISTLFYLCVTVCFCGITDSTKV